jgi:4-diphosphocytidyl-2-C-methyl-D-erythritol kinase
MSSNGLRKSAPWPAPAKLNLCLHILGQEDDGYHQLQTLFQILDWGDELLIQANQSGDINRTINIQGIPYEQDIIVKAARALQTIGNVKQGADIEVHKRIPMGAGLGGGSSNAATVLQALNSIWNCGLDTDQLALIGLELGADVPVFIRGRSAWAQGRGEKLMPVTMGDRYYVLVFPEFGIATAEVFKHPALKRDSIPLDLCTQPLLAGKNDCESAALVMFPKLKKMKQSLVPWGKARMTGTGSCLFLQFDCKKTSIRAASELKCLYNVRAVGGVDRSALLDRLLS